MLDKKEINNLIRRMARNDTTAWGELYHLTSSYLLAVAMPICKNCRADAEDIVQEAFVRIRTNASSFTTMSNGLSWIITITRNTALNYIRKDKRLTSLESTAEIFDDYSIEDELDHEYDKLYVDKLLDTLSEDEATALRLSYIEGLTVRKVAARMNKAKSTVQDLINRATKKLGLIIKK